MLKQLKIQPFIFSGHFVPLAGLAVLLTIVPLHPIYSKMTEKDMKEKENNVPEAVKGMDLNTDENLSGTTHLNEPVTEESELEKIKTQLQEANDKFIRKVAEFDNFKRRNAKERIELIQTAGKEVITDILVVLDDCDRAQNQMETSDDVKTIKEGILLVFNKLRNALQARGLKAMETTGQEFNPDLHEAITEISMADEKMKGKVVDETLKGYYLNDKIIRHAKVVVGK